MNINDSQIDDLNDDYYDYYGWFEGGFRSVMLSRYIIGSTLGSKHASRVTDFGPRWVACFDLLSHCRMPKNWRFFTH